MTSTNPHLSNPSMQWSDEYLLGYSPIDSIHENFVELLGSMQSADDAALPGLMAQFAAHCAEHFETENHWMRETEFPPRECHIDEHAAVLKSVQEVQALLEEGNFYICRDLIMHLADWFPKHTSHLDSALAHWMTKKSLGGKPVVLKRGLTLR